MRRIALTFLAVSMLMSMASARADTETDRLRDAIRNLTGQLRTFEDQRAQAQAKLTQAEREKALALQSAERLKGQLKEAQKALQDAVEEFNKRLANRDETLDKWKAAYAEAAQVAQEKDVLRAKFESEAGLFKARTKSCEAKNLQLLKVNGEIVAAYRDLKPIDAALIREPLIGIARVNHQNKVQELTDRILDQDARLPDAPPQERSGDTKGDAKKETADKSDGRKTSDTDSRPAAGQASNVQKK